MEEDAQKATEVAVPGSDVDALPSDTSDMQLGDGPSPLEELTDFMEQVWRLFLLR